MHAHVRAQGRTPAGTHVPVMVADVLEALNPQPGEIVADCTLGFGGHARELIRHIGSAGCFLGLDVDSAQLERTAAMLSALVGAAPGLPGDALRDQGGGYEDSEAGATRSAPPRLTFHRSHFAGLGKVLAREGLDGCDVILADLGCSSMQLDDWRRGFSYKHDGPLDMRMDDRLKRTAADLLAGLSEGELSAALDLLADEPHHVRIARAIVAQRRARPITRTRQLVKLIESAKADRARRTPQRKPLRRATSDEEAREARSSSGSIERDDALVKDSSTARETDVAAAARTAMRAPLDLHPAARTFQALRMLVNDEIGGLEQFLRAVPYCLRPGGRLAILSFHSGEHRRVEAALSEGLASGVYSEASPAPTTPTYQEVHGNPRSRSAELRWAVRA